MAIDTSLNLGVQGIQKGMDSLRRDADDIAGTERLNGESPRDVAEPLVNLKQDQLQVQSAAKVVKAADEMIGTLIDEMA